jgi:hypothetical protein
LALGQRRVEKASELLRQSLAVQRPVADLAGIAMNLEDLARVAEVRGDPVVMVKLLGAADAFRELNGVSLSAFERQASERAVTAARTSLDEAAFQSAWTGGRGLPLDEAIALIDTDRR